jgi:hypothetical protein
LLPMTAASAPVSTCPRTAVSHRFNAFLCLEVNRCPERWRFTC